jgi:hypothetical protein
MVMAGVVGIFNAGDPHLDGELGSDASYRGIAYAPTFKVNGGGGYFC